MKRTPLRRKTPMRQRSDKEQARRVEYEASRDVVRARSNGRCEAQINGVCKRRGDQAHHVKRRSRGRDDSPENLLWICYACHHHVHANPAWANEQGFLT
jgi:hypothetical protein